MLTHVHTFLDPFGKQKDTRHGNSHVFLYVFFVGVDMDDCSLEGLFGQLKVVPPGLFVGS
jgi:hypothetical protein